MLVAKQKQKNSQPSSGFNFPAQRSMLTLDHSSVSADRTAQDHTEDHAKYHDHSNGNAHRTDDVELVVEEVFDGLRAGLGFQVVQDAIFGADVLDKLLYASNYATAVQRFVDDFQCFPLGLVLAFQLVIGVDVKVLEALDDLILVGKAPGSCSYFNTKYHQEGTKEQSQHAL